MRNPIIDESPEAYICREDGCALHSAEHPHRPKLFEKFELSEDAIETVEIEIPFRTWLFSKEWFKWFAAGMAVAALGCLFWAVGWAWAQHTNFFLYGAMVVCVAFLVKQFKEAFFP